MTDYSSAYAEAMEEYREAVRDLDADDWIETDKHNYPIRQIFRDHFSVVLQNPGLTPEQKKAVWCIANCKTPGIGFNAAYCPECKTLKLHYVPATTAIVPVASTLPSRHGLSSGKTRSSRMFRITTLS